MDIEKSVGRLGGAIEQRRSSLGLTQAQVCDLAGVGPSFLHQLEHGKRSVRFDKLLAVLEVLGLGLNLRESRQLLDADEELRGEDA